MTRTVVVGAGAAGSALAARLSADASREVLLIEAGADAAPPELRDGGRLRGADPAHPANWAYRGELRPGVTADVARGKIVGGSTAINGGYFERATPADFDRWARVGGAAWAYDRALPVLRGLEHDLDFGSSPVHGASGPVRIARPPQDSPAAAALTAAALSLGFPLSPDKNDAGAVGAGPVPSNIIDGVRLSAAASYLTPEVRSRISLCAGVRVRRVRFSGSRAIGVETSAGFIAADEVVLCAGGIATPQLLLLSGIGPSPQLASFGIPVVADLPVGEALHDHPNLAIEWRAARSVVDWDAGFAFPTALNFDSASGPFEAGAGSSEGDLEILLSAKPLEFLIDGARPSRETLHLMVALQAPVGRGRLSLASNDPCAPPRIEYRYAEAPEDRAGLRVAVRTAAALLESPAFDGVFEGFGSSAPAGAPPLSPAALGRDDLLDAWVAAHLGTALHTCATAPMGPVVDGAGRVHGVTGLRVADLSVLPSAPHRGPANTAVFIGELVARMMLM